MNINKTIQLTCGLALALPVMASSAVAQDVVRTFSMPYYTGFSIYVADELGFYEEYGVETDPRWFPSGAPIIQAAAARQWDIAFLGAPPAVLAGPQLNLQTIGIVAEEASIHQLIGRPSFVAEVEADNSVLEDAQIFVTTLSTGHYMVEGCLAAMGLTQDDVTILPSEQTATVSAFAAGQGDLAQVWPPSGAALLGAGNTLLCDGIEAGLSIPAIWVADPEFAVENPDVVVRWLRATLQAIDWIQEDPERTFEMYQRYDQFRGFETDEEALRAESVLAASVVYTGAEQLELMSPFDGESSYVVRGYEGVAGFFNRVDRMDGIPDYNELVDSSFLEQALQE